LKNARAAAFATRAKVGLGEDPQAARREARAEASVRRVRTVSDLIDDYLVEAAGRLRESTIKLDRMRFDVHVRPALGKLRVEDVTRGDVRALTTALHRSGRTVTANRVRRLVGTLYRHARTRLELKVENPVEGLSQYSEVARDRVLTDRELRAIWLSCEKPDEIGADLSVKMALCIQLCTATLQRVGEVCGIDERELDLSQRLWLLPASRSKAGRAKKGAPHLVPLSDMAITVIRRALVLKGGAQGMGPLFPSPRDAFGLVPISRHAVTRAMSRVCAEHRIEDATMHDLRRTGATNITGERIGMARFVVSAVLGHTSEMGGVTSVYDRNTYLAEKRRALDAWGVLLASIVGEEPTSTSSGRTACHG
jgi:integrase